MTHHDWDGGGDKHYSPPDKTPEEIKQTLLNSIDKQLAAIIKDGSNKGSTDPIKWHDNNSRYAHKYEVLMCLKDYLNDKKTINDLRTTVDNNPKYDRGFSLRSTTGKLLDDALHFKKETLVEQNTLKPRR